jgi:hypothetical protein
MTSEIIAVDECEDLDLAAEISKMPPSLFYRFTKKTLARYKTQETLDIYVTKKLKKSGFNFHQPILCRELADSFFYAQVKPTKTGKR